jgi:hypothetical protein
MYNSCSSALQLDGDTTSKNQEGYHDNTLQAREASARSIEAINQAPDDHLGWAQTEIWGFVDWNYVNEHTLAHTWQPAGPVITKFNIEASSSALLQNVFRSGA